MNETYAKGQKYHFSVDTEELGVLTIDGNIIFNDGEVAVVKVEKMYIELESYTLSYWEACALVPGFEDPTHAEIPFQEYAVIDAETGDFIFATDLDTGEMIDLRS